MSKKNASKENILSIQLLRGIAALMVVFSHTAGVAVFEKGSFLWRCCAYGWTGVEVFFIISGFIIPYSMYKNNYIISDLGKVMVRRIVRIEPPYLLSICMLLLLYYLSVFSPWYTGPKNIKHFDWLNVLGHIGYVNAFINKAWLNPVYWTLAIEFEYYVLIGIMFPLIFHKNSLTRILTHILLLLTLFILPRPYLHPGTAILSNAHICNYIPFFLIGIALFSYRSKIIPLNQFLFFITIDILAWAIRTQFTDLLLPCLCITTLLSIQYIKKVPKAFLWLGNISYSLYLTHVLVMSRSLALLEKIMHKKYMGIQIILSIVCCIAGGYLFYLIAEKPFTEMSKKIKYISTKSNKNMNPLSTSIPNQKVY